MVERADRKGLGTRESNGDSIAGNSLERGTTFRLGSFSPSIQEEACRSSTLYPSGFACGWLIFHLNFWETLRQSAINVMAFFLRHFNLQVLEIFVCRRRRKCKLLMSGSFWLRP